MSNADTTTETETDAMGEIIEHVDPDQDPADLSVAEIIDEQCATAYALGRLDQLWVLHEAGNADAEKMIDRLYGDIDEPRDTFETWREELGAELGRRVK